MKDGQRGFGYEEIIALFEFLNDNIYIRVGDYVFKHIFGITIGTNRAPCLTNINLFSMNAVS